MPALTMSLSNVLACFRGRTTDQIDAISNCLKMHRIDAIRMLASMIDHMPVWNRSECNFVTDYVC